MRTESFGQTHRLTWTDRLGVAWSAWRVRRSLPAGAQDLLEVGAGYHARLAMALRPRFARVTAVDVQLSPDLTGIQRREGKLPETLTGLPDQSQDVILAINVLEHLWEPLETLRHAHRLLKPHGTLVVNVPSWRGKHFLEFSAFRLGWSPRSEMNDHKTYYDPRDLWPLLVKAGFVPDSIQCHRHKLGLNTYAVCRKGPR